MSSLIVSDNVSLIVGGGITGLSIARYLKKKGLMYRVYDTRDVESVVAPFKEIDPETQCYLGEYNEDYLAGISQIILSPGVSRGEQIIKAALKMGLPVKGDIKLFLEQVAVPVIGITGSNGKSTVTTMVGLAAEHAGINVAVGGNLGTPALDLIDEAVELYVLELSSFQLESTENAALSVAVNLNVSPDHLDRHGSMPAYFQAKQKIFHMAKNVVYNLSDTLTQPPLVDAVARFGFGLSPVAEQREMQFYLSEDKQNLLRERSDLMPKAKIKQQGLHNVENVLAVFAIAEAANIKFESVIAIAKSFPGLAHRCEFVADDGVTYINDSKATNVGSAAAAVMGFASGQRKLILIAGGEGKGADFSDLGSVIAKHVKAVVLIGTDAKLIEQAVAGRAACQHAQSLEAAVDIAASLAERGDIVLFSPACASFDMFANFEDRGDQFKTIVRGRAV